MDKIALLHRLELPETNVIHFLIRGIASRLLRATASALKVDSIDLFLDEMHRITLATADSEKKPVNDYIQEKSKDLAYKGCGKKRQRNCNANKVTCFCKMKGHVIADGRERRSKLQARR